MPCGLASKSLLESKENSLSSEALNSSGDHMLNQEFFETPSPFPSTHQRRREAKTLERNLKKGSKPFAAIGPIQEILFKSLEDDRQTVVIGPAGTGKTYVPARYGARLLRSKKVDKLLIARPTISDSRHALGFLPGKLDQKLAPWLVPIMDAFKDEFSPEELKNYRNNEQIEFISFEHLRGRTLKNCFVLLDEAQNCTYGDMKLFLTRKGENSQFVVTGDTSQIDLPKHFPSGLPIIVDIIENYDLSPTIVKFTEEDVVRSEDAKEWVSAFVKYESEAIQN